MADTPKPHPLLKRPVLLAVGVLVAAVFIVGGPHNNPVAHADDPCAIYPPGTTLWGKCDSGCRTAMRDNGHTSYTYCTGIGDGYLVICHGADTSSPSCDTIDGPWSTANNF
jgi:hypothetical protein